MFYLYTIFTKAYCYRLAKYLRTLERVQYCISMALVFLIFTCCVGETQLSVSGDAYVNPRLPLPQHRSPFLDFLNAALLNHGTSDHRFRISMRPLQAIKCLQTKLFAPLWGNPFFESKTNERCNSHVWRCSRIIRVFYDIMSHFPPFELTRPSWQGTVM